jgi:hypothetical protein
MQNDLPTRVAAEPWNKGKLVGQKPPEAARYLGHPNPAPARSPPARPSDVQPGHRQQAAGR